MQFYDFPILGSETGLPLFLLSVGINEWQYHLTCTEGDSCHKMLYCTKGRGRLAVGGEEYIIEPYTAFFIPKGTPHEYETIGDCWDTHWVIPAGYACDTMLLTMGFDRPMVFPAPADEIQFLEHCLRKMHEAVRSDRVSGNHRASGYLYSFCIEFQRLASRSRSRDHGNPVVTLAVDYIDLHYSEPLTLEQMSTAAGVSAQHLCRVFRTTLNCRPMEYLAKRRIQAAKELLSKTGQSVEAIAEATGFCDGSYFCKLFKRYEGITPTQFRSGK